MLQTHYFLRQVIPPDSGQPIEIHFTTDEVHVGRRKIASLTGFTQMSREHAVFYKSDSGGILVKDLNSLNGVFVNDVKIGSSLKELATGDIIGFGVTSSLASEGFVCILCAEPRANPEVIEISDEDLSFDSEKKSSSGDSNLQIPILEEDGSEASSESCVSNTTPRSADDVFERSPEHTSVKKCVIPVVRCDSSRFQFPPDVKNPFQNDYKRKKDYLHRRRKRIRVLSTDSSQDSESGVQRNISSKLNGDTARDCPTNSETVRRRKPPDILPLETMNDNRPSSSKKIKTSVKPEASTSREFPDKSDNEVSYSQIEEIILISDDESYLDFNSSQNYVHIKKEPEEEVENNVIEDDMYKEIFERESNEFDDAPHNSKAFHSQDPDDRVESIESILAFVSNSVQKGPDSDSCSRNNCVRINNSIFPVPSEDTDSEAPEDADSVSDDDADGDALRSDRLYFITDGTSNIGCGEYKSTKKCSGKIQLIDPKPMSYRPRRLRGRDEGFVAKTKHLHRSAPLAESCGKKKSVKEKILDSKIRESTSVCYSKHRFRTNQVSGNEKNHNLSELASTSRNEISSPKKASVKTRPEKFSSRMRFLTSDVEIHPQHGKKGVRAPQPATERGVAPASRVPVTDTGETPKRTPDSSAEGKLKHDNNSSSSKKRSYDAFPGRAVSPRKNSPPSPKISFHSLVQRILQMNTKWLQEQMTVKSPPPEVSKGAVDLPLSYGSYSAYASSFYPMIMLEIWEYMYTESEVVYSSEKQYKKFYFTVVSYAGKEDCIELKCESVVNEKVCFCPREGVISVLELKNNSRKCSPVFSYIYKHKVEPLNLDCMGKWKNLPETWLKSAKHWTFYAFIKKKEMSIELGSIMKGNGLCYIRSRLRLADALQCIKDSPLLNDILTPRESTFLVNGFLSSPSREYSSSQRGIINSVFDEIVKPHPQPKIVLLQGPPGTGKTHAIIGLLDKLFFDSKAKSNFKVLVAAPSNEVIDEIGCRLVELNQRSGWRDGTVKFVRVGLEKQIHSKMLPYFVDRKAKDLYMQSPQFAKSKEKESRQLLSEINKLEMDPPSKDRDERIKNLRNKHKLLKDQSSVKHVDYYTEMMYKENVLKGSHIVLSTLSSCGLSIFRSFKSNPNECFTCCIIDEATQCTELEVLQPLAFGVNKLVLVGDPEQLPASVLSKHASQCGFERSMFERFHLYFQRVKKNPILTLTEQFRMHPAICEFPSKHFYAHQLLTHPGISLKYKDFPLHPYVVLDVSLGPEPLNPPPETDAYVLLSICEFIAGCCKKSESSIGLIVSHQARRSFHIRELCRDKHIEINTIDGFQGREKDVIILSVIGANSHREGVKFMSSRQLLNVAVTRARKCLVVLCANAAELMIYPDWRALVHDAQERNLYAPVPFPPRLHNVLFKGKKETNA